MSVPISVVVCTRNRLCKLQRCIEALVSVHTEHEWELIIVDNASDDGTHAYLAVLPDHLGKTRVITTFESKRGLGAARNRGLREAHGDIVAFTDDDCYVSKGYIDAMIAAFDNPEIGFVGGRILLYDRSDLRLTIQESEEYSVFKPYTAVGAGLVQGANMAFRRASLDRIGGFDDDLGSGTSFACEDADAVAALLWEGVVGAYDPRPIVYHHHGRKTEREGVDLVKTYDKARGAYYAKYILRADTRYKYAKRWIVNSIYGAIIGGDKTRLYYVRQSWRELRGGVHYLSTRLTRNGHSSASTVLGSAPGA